MFGMFVNDAGEKWRYRPRNLPSRRGQDTFNFGYPSEPDTAPARPIRMTRQHTTVENRGMKIRDLVFDFIDTARDDHPSSVCDY